MPEVNHTPTLNSDNPLVASIAAALADASLAGGLSKEYFRSADESLGKLSNAYEGLVSESAKAADGIKHLQAENHNLRLDINAFRQRHADEFWYWQDDGEDFPESLTCPVMVRAETIQRMAAAEAENAELRAAVDRCYGMCLEGQKFTLDRDWFDGWLKDYRNLVEDG